MTNEDLDTAVFAVVMADGRVTVNEIAERIGVPYDEACGSVVRLLLTGRLCKKFVCSSLTR